MNSRVRKVLLLGNVVLALLALSAKAAPGGGGTKPVLLTAPKSINNATVGSAITLAATASGSPAPQWKWYLQGIQIPGATNSSLVLTNAQPTDGGAFQVVAYNSAGQDKASFTVNFKLDPLPFADDFAKRGTITGNSGLGAGSNTSAKKETGEPAHWSGKHDRTVWLQWTAPQSGVATFSTDGSDFDTVLAVYTGSSLTNLVRLVNDDNSGGYGNSQVKFNATAGTTYAVVVAGIGDGRGGAKGNIVLAWDLLVTATQLSYVTQQPLSTSLPVGGTLALTVNLSANQQSSPAVQWYFENDPISGATATSLVIENVQAANVGLYRAHLQWDGPGTASFGYFSQGADIQINTEGLTTVLAQNRQIDSNLTPLASPPRSPTARLRARLTTVAGYSGSQIFATRFGKDPSEPDHCGVDGGSSYWLNYLAPVTGTVLLSTVGSSYDTVLAVYVDDGKGKGYDSLISIACDDNSGPDGRTSKLQFDCTAGATYYVVVDGVNGAYGTAYLNYSVVTPPTISALAAQTIAGDTSTAVLSFTVGGGNTGVSNLIVTASAANASLVPAAGIVLGGSDANRTIKVTPAVWKHGTTTVTVNVQNAVGAVASTSFTLTVTPVNHAPTAGTVNMVRPVNISGKLLLKTLLAACADPDGDAPTLVSIAGASYKGVKCSKDSTYLYYPAIPGQNTPDYFTYTLSDGKGGTATGRVNVYAQ
ncbi:hypothetical protein LBMAG56_37390 [Verrucomicrobiota bacterium]|nr:hypothetical protein LBMAG56_37390 [Verrucomicrobiota bacterium]